jgi:hypothetical protein
MLRQLGSLEHSLTKEEKRYAFWKLLDIVVTYSQFDSNIRVLYVFLGFLKNTWKYLKILDHRCLWVWAQLKLSLLNILLIVFTYFTYSHFQILKYLKYFFLSTFEKYAYFVCHYYATRASWSWNFFARLC